MPLFSAEYGPRNGASSRLFCKKKSAPLGSNQTITCSRATTFVLHKGKFRSAESRFLPRTW